MTLPETLALFASTLTALVGLLVAYQAYRGYRRNGSEPMRALAVGIVLIAVVPHAIITPITAAVALTDAQALVAVLLAHTLGLLAVYRSMS